MTFERDMLTRVGSVLVISLPACAQPVADEADAQSSSTPERTSVRLGALFRVAFEELRGPAEAGLGRLADSSDAASELGSGGRGCSSASGTSRAIRGNWSRVRASMQLKVKEAARGALTLLAHGVPFSGMRRCRPPRQIRGPDPHVRSD